MSPRDALVFLLLAAIWGGSFLFLRLTAPALGPLAVAALRTTGAALVLLPLVLWQGQWRALQPVWRTVLVSAMLSCVLPFMGLSWAAQHLPAGPLSVLNATAPMWSALLAWAWRGESLGRAKALGLSLGFGGVMWLALHRGADAASLDPLAVAVALGSTLMYALAVDHSKRHLPGLPPIALSAALMVCTAAALLGPALWWGPQATLPSPTGSPMPGSAWAEVSLGVWAALAALATLCTGLAYVMFYGLIERIGPSTALNVVFLIPPFGMLWGWLWLDEAITLDMLLSAGVIVLGTFLASRAPVSAGALKRPGASTAEH
ncbi:DMT family transporter [Aquabacterium lacunae]|uniref:DMT family transporter n=1 Tax=Aquabacterium lacunae TaxID=2528630 RepID=A0A4Q9H555_9BURK|nr:DMT family transporter [Aquabacterium lacunae]TBO32854.1 DMT family transporter [Aquabacterium lacunae]